MAEENKHPPTTEEQAPPEMSGKAPEMEQAEIPDVGGGPAPSAKVIDLSAVRPAPERDAPPDIPKEPEAPPVSVTEVIHGTVYTVTGSYEGTESFVRKLERITSKKFAEKMEDSE